MKGLAVPRLPRHFIRPLGMHSSLRISSSSASIVGSLEGSRSSQLMELYLNRIVASSSAVWVSGNVVTQASLTAASQLGQQREVDPDPEVEVVLQRNEMKAEVVNT